MTVPKPPDDAKVVGSESGDQAAIQITPSAASSAGQIEDLIDLIARLAAQRRLREAKQSLSKEFTHEQPENELEKP